MSAACLAHLTVAAASRWGSRVALRIPGQSDATYDSIDAAVARIAGGLRALGVHRGDRVVIHLPNGLEWIIAYHATVRLGAVVIPANILLSAAEVTYMVEDAEPVVLIVTAERRDSFRGLPIRVVTCGAAADAILFDDLMSADAVGPEALGSDDLLAIGYTSGTTGRPKGAVLTHGNVYASLAATATMHGRNERDVVLSSLPFPHVYGNIVMNAMFLAGTRLITTARFDAGEALRLIGKHKVTLFEGVPTMYFQMLAHDAIGQAELGSLTRCTVGGQTIPRAKLEQVVARFGCDMLELWGMTEVAGPAVTHSPFWPPHLGSIGLAVPGTEIRIADLADPTIDVPVGQSGELMVRGAQVMRGYWKREEATAEAIDANGWLATGDIAVKDKDGYYTIIDRKKDLIITAGYNIYPIEIEQVIATHPAVVMVAVAGIEDIEKGELAVAFIVRRDGSDACEADIIAYCKERLAAYKAPRRVVFLDDLPKTSSGKILRRALRETYRQNETISD